jgi:serine protease AprX
MKHLLLAAFVLILSIFGAEAQYPKLIVRLKDKGSNTFSISNPSQYLSARALQRRSRYNINIDSLDLPVTQRYLDSISKTGVTILSTSKWLNQVLIQTTDQAAINKINALPFVVSTQPIGLRVAGSTPDKFKETIEPIKPGQGSTQRTMTDVFNYGNNYSQVHIHEGEYLHNKGFKGETVQIAVLDAGFFSYRTITAFDSIRNNGQVLGEKDFVAFDNSVNEDDTHGMYCLSTMAANWPTRMVGTAPKAKYWLIRTENVASEFPIEEHNWVVGAEYADSTGSDLISSSLGYNTFDDPAFNHSYNDFYKNATMVTRGATTAARKGMIVMNSAGNEGSISWKYLGFPADADSVCAVGAVSGSGAIAGFSSFGYPGKIKPNIVSVGVATVIAGLNNQPTSGNGTSFSNPNVAGLVACLWQAFPAYNNMKILDAVYRSSDRYATPDDRYGFGIPNFRLAYQILKKQENTALYGNEWLFATPDPFTTQIDAKFLGRIDGPATLQLLDPSGQVVGTANFTTEKEEVYTFSFTNLGSMPSGIYTVKYTDATTTRSIQLQKGAIAKDWFIATPNPFHNQLTVYLRAPEAGDVDIRLLDAKGALVDVASFTVALNETRTIIFRKAAALQSGVYVVQYVSKTQKRIIKLLKQ